MTLMECIKRYFCCSCTCRRKMLTSKLVPALMQLLVVAIIWFIFHTRDKNNMNVYEEGSLSALGTDGLPLCSPGDFTKGKLLRINNIMSSANVLATDQNDQPQFLNVEIIVRDLEQGSLMLYPIGTPVTFGGSNAPEEIKADDDDEKRHEVVNDEGHETDVEPLDPIPNQSEINSAITSDTQNDYPLTDTIVSNPLSPYAVDNSQPSEQNLLSMLSKTGFQDKESVAMQATGIGTGVSVNTVVGIGSDAAAGFSVDAGIPEQVANAQSSPYASENQFPKDSLAQQLGGSNLGMPQQYQQFQPQFHQQLQQQQSQQVQQQQSAQPQQQQQLQQKPQMPMQYQQQAQQDISGLTLVNNPSSSSLTIANTSVDAGIDLTVDEDGPLYSDGFHERIASFSTEYYGKPVSPSIIDPSSNFLLNNPDRCNGEEAIDILYLVHAQPQSDERRSAIRNSYVQNEVFQGFHIAHVFLVGRTTSPNFQSNLNKEHQQYGDIIQGDFMDKPENATKKGLMGMKWAKRFCRKAKYIMKIDEDVFVDSDKLLRGLIPAADKVVGKRAILCYLMKDALVPRSGPRAFSRDVFPHSATLRPFCKGFAVLMTKGVLGSLIATEHHTPRLHVEDIYLYGVLPYLAGNIEVFDVGQKRAFHDFGMEVVNCYKDLQDKCPFVVSKAFSARFTNLWDFVKERMSASHSGWEGENSLWDVQSFRSRF